MMKCYAANSDDELEGCANEDYGNEGMEEGGGGGDDFMP